MPNRETALPTNLTVDKAQQEPIGNILFLKASKDICSFEMGALSNFCSLIGLQIYSEEIVDDNSITNIAIKYSKKKLKFDYVYLCAHGRKEGFVADLDGKEKLIKWSTFGGSICENEILDEGTIFLLACCQGGLLQVAIDIMAVCNKINYICGVKWTVLNWDLTTGFIVFLHNLINRKTEPSYAAEKATNATDFTFVCNDRDEIEALPQYLNRQNELFYQLKWIDEEGNTITDDPRVLDNTGLAATSCIDERIPTDLNSSIREFQVVNQSRTA